MPAPPDFRLYHGNDLDLLADLLASQLAVPEPGASVLEPETVLIPQPAMRRWLHKTLAEKHGIAANLRFLTPGEFVNQALSANLAGDDAPVANADTLRWRLWALLADEAVMKAPVFAPLQPVLAGPDRALAAWSLAGEMAAAFEKYQAWRRDWLLRWEAGASPNDPQAILWRRIAGGEQYRARRIDAYLARFEGAGRPLPQGLPARVFAFATLNISPDVLRVMATQARVGTMHFYLPTPTQAYWGDLQTLGEKLR
ncbi:MAG: exodeoxyribonuclease V subunit gamma, partial [Arenimonas sp.]|uniref:exodeoxyribonuclease V subunit gamma n=1 Tax=Arenimonas sp. TaxID=1872635 RepID=UPI0025BF337D